MFTKYLKPKKPGKDKEISLIAESASPQDLFVAKVAKSTLAKYSEFFRKMAENGEFKKSKEIRLKGVTTTALQKFVQYMKSESVFFQDHSEAIETLKAAYLYQITAMNDICSNFLITVTDPENVCDVYEFAASCSFQHVEYHCLKTIDSHAEQVLNSPGFRTLKKTTVAAIIKRNSLRVSSDVVVFRAVLAWGRNECLRKHGNADNAEELFRSVDVLLGYVRFLTLTEEELSDPEVDQFYKRLCPEDSPGKRRSLISLEPKARSATVDSQNTHVRQYFPDYACELVVAHTDEHAVKNGESFCLKIEALKGRVFLTGITLAFERFVSSKNASCLYVAFSARNVQTAEEVTARGAFMISEEEALLKFPHPLVIKESEVVEMSLKIKRAINICSVVIKSESQIVLPETKDVAMKIMPSSSNGGTERSLFKGVKYFY